MWSPDDDLQIIFYSHASKCMQAFFNSESFWNLFKWPIQLPSSNFIEILDDVCLFTPCRGDKKVICNKFVQQVSSVCYSLAYIVTEELLFQGNLHNHSKEECS